jgi:hypothetical protein
MQQSADWWVQSAFVRDYFFGGQKKVAHQVAEYLARYYVGEDISELTPSTDVSELMSDSIRRCIHRDDFTLDRDTDLLAEIDFSEHITFQELVGLIHESRRAGQA